MFSGKKFRLWSRQSASKKDAEKESSKDKSKSTSLPKGEDESYRQPNTLQEKSHLQKLQEDYARLEQTVEELTPFKTKACALEKKLIYITKSFERKQSRYSTVIASLEVENEQLREEIRRMKSICSSCYFCSRHRMMTAHPEAAKQHFHGLRRTYQSSSESLGSSESWRRLQKLEDEQSAIAKETSRQKQETSRCLEQISCEVMKAIVSQKALRKDCTQLQCRIVQLEKQNSQLNDIIFRQYPLSASQTKFLTAQRNEVSACNPQLAPTWDEHSLHSSGSLETLRDEEKASHKLFRIPPDQRFSKEICRPTSDCMSYNYIPEQVMVNSNSTEHKGTNHGRQNAPFQKDVYLVDSVPKNAQGSLHCFFSDTKNEGKNVNNWESSTSSTLTLRDETVNDDSDSMTHQQKNSLNRGSTFSLNDILDGDIDELQFSIQSRGGTKNNDNTGNTNSTSMPGDGKCTLQHQNDCQQENSKTAMFIGATKDTSASQITSYSSPGSKEQILKEQKEPTQVPFSRASKDVQSLVSFDNCSVTKRNAAGEKRHRYSYPATLSEKNALTSGVHKIYSTQNEKSTGMNMSEPKKALQTDNKQKQDVQKFRLWNFETYFDNSDTEKRGTIKERTVSVSRSQPQIAQHKIRPRGATAEKAGAEKNANENAKISTPLQVDMLQGDASHRTASGGSPEKGSTSQERIFGGNTSIKSLSQQNLSQWNVSEGVTLQETPPNVHSSAGNPLMGSPPNSNASWVNNWQLPQLEANPSWHNSSLAVHTIRQDRANKQDSSPNCCDCKPEQVMQSKERKQEQNDIPAESVDIKAKTEDIVYKKKERIDFIFNENSSKDLARDVIISKDKVMALTAYFEEVHAEQCPDCQQSGTRCKISSAFRYTSGSKDNSSFEDDSNQVDGNSVIDLEENQNTKPQDHAAESLKTVENHELPINETLKRQLSGSETSKYEAAFSDSSVCETSIQETPYITSDDSHISKNLLVTDTGLKVSPHSRANSSQEADSQIEGTRLTDEMDKANTSESVQFEHNLVSSLCESTSVNQRIKNTKDHKNGDLKMCLFGGKTLKKTPSEQLVSKRIQWKSLPSVSLSTPPTQPPYQINYIRTLSLKSFSDVVTPPPSPKLHKQNENNKPLDRPHSHFQESNEDVFNIYQTSQKPQHQAHNQPSDQPQENSQSNTKSHSDLTEKESQGCFQNYGQVHSPGHTKGKQLTVFSGDKAEAQNCPQETHLYPQVHSTHQEQFKVFTQDESHFCAQSYPQDLLQDDLFYPSHHNPRTNPEDKAVTTRLPPEKGCLLLSSAKIQQDDRIADLTSYAYPDLVSGSYPRPSICRSQRSNETERKSNVLTEEDIMKYRLDCHDSRRTTTGSYPRELQSNIVSLADMDSPGYSDDLRMLAAKPPLPPRRFHVTKYYGRDSSNLPLDPQDFLNFENEFLGLNLGTPHADATPSGNELLAEPNQRTPVWEMDKNCASHLRRVDFNYPEAAGVWQGGDTDSLAPQSTTICHSHLTENSEPSTYVSPTQGYRSVESWQSSGKRNSYPDSSGKAYSQSQAWWDDKGNAADTTWHYPLEQHQTTRPVSSHQATETASYGFNNPLYISTAQRKLPAHCQQLEDESSQKNKTHTESDSVFNEISKQIENLQQTISELQKKSTEN